MKPYLPSASRLGGLILACCSTICVGANPPQAKPALPATTAADPDKIIQQAGDFLHDAKSFRTDAMVVGTANVQGRPQPIVMRYQFALTRPDHIAAIQKTSLPSPTIVCDGKQYYTFAPAQMKYSIRKAPTLPNESISDDLLRAGNGAGLILAWALEDKPAEAIRKGTVGVKYKGLDTSIGAKCHLLVFDEGQWTRELWVEAGERPLIRKIAFSRVSPAGQTSPRPGSLPQKPEIAITFANWSVDSDLPAETFQFTPPPGAKQVTAARMEEPRYPAYTLQGEAAPPVMLPLLEGGQLNLAKLKGSIVVLDFWATWCPPCREGLPILAAIAKEYKDKGVQVYAINCSEEPAKVRQFLSSTQLQLPVAIDTGRTISARYKMQAIPETIIIDKNGIVQCVHVGLPGNAAQSYRQTLDALLAGKDLSQEVTQEGQVSTGQGQE